MCVDYRKLNAITQADPYPLHLYKELIDRIGKSTFITTLDLTTDGISEQGQDSVCHAFWKIPIPNYANWFNLSTFYLPKVDEVLWELHPFARAYLDGILIHSATWEDHLGHLSRVLQWIRQVGLCIKAQKCNFAVNECKYLGHIVGKGRIRPMQCKVDAVQVFTQPTTKNQVRVFTGLCGYYRRFFPNFSQLQNL